jgi:hypothetical protein
MSLQTSFGSGIIEESHGLRDGAIFSARVVGGDIQLICSCHHLPFATLRGSVLVIESQHRGEKCVNLLPLIAPLIN